MKYVILFLISLSSHAECYYDNYGNATCIETAPRNYDSRTDRNSMQIYEGNQYRGNINNNPYDPNSINNPYGRYGNPYSPDSLSNPYRTRQ